MLRDNNELSLIKLISQWPRVVELSAKHMEPHRICYYLIELASEFHSLWNKGKVDENLKFIHVDDSSIQDHACRLLTELMYKNDDVKNTILKNDGIITILKAILNHGRGGSFCTNTNRKTTSTISSNSKANSSSNNNIK